MQSILDTDVHKTATLSCKVAKNAPATYGLRVGWRTMIRQSSKHSFIVRNRAKNCAIALDLFDTSAVYEYSLRAGDQTMGWNFMSLTALHCTHAHNRGSGPH